MVITIFIEIFYRLFPSNFNWLYPLWDFCACVVMGGGLWKLDYLTDRFSFCQGEYQYFMFWKYFTLNPNPIIWSRCRFGLALQIWEQIYSQNMKQMQMQIFLNLIQIQLGYILINITYPQPCGRAGGFQMELCLSRDGFGRNPIWLQISPCLCIQNWYMGYNWQ